MPSWRAICAIAPVIYLPTIMKAATDHAADFGGEAETILKVGDALGLYTELLKLVQGNSVALEEYARDLISQEEAHIDEIDKMLRKPGDTAISKEARDLD